MNKKGQVETVLGILLIIGLVGAGVYSTSELLSEHRYVGDISKNVSYDLARCVVNIEEENFIAFKNKQEAESGFRLTTCN